MNPYLTEVLANHASWAMHTNAQLINQIQIIENSYYSYYSSRSRTLNDALRNTLGAYTGRYNTPNAYKILKGMCTLLLRNKNIRVMPEYLPLQESQCANLDSLITAMSLPAIDNNYINIHIYSVPKGKSYLKTLLDQETQLERFKVVETCCIQNPHHFIRVYKGFKNTDTQDITIFTSEVSRDLIAMLWVLLPGLLGLQQEPIGENSPELVEKLQKHNKRIDILLRFCQYLYELNSTNTQQQVNAMIREFTNAFADTFDFQAQNLNTFTERLANATNQNAIKHYKSLIDNANSNIKSLESQLTNYYNEKRQYERELMMNKKVSVEDVQPFFDTIKSSKQIEIISSSNTTLTLRITAPLQYFSEDFERYEKNTSSDYNYYYRNLTDYKRILHKIFVTREYQLITQAVITFTISETHGSTPVTIAATTSSLSQFTQFPNPHLYHYNCWSQAKAEMIKNICTANYELVVMQAIAAVQTVNVAEHASFVSGLLGDFRNSSFEHLIHIIDSNNNVYTLPELLAHEKELKQKEELQILEQKLEETQKAQKEYTQIEIPYVEDDFDDNEYPTENNNETNNA